MLENGDGKYDTTCLFGGSGQQGKMKNSKTCENL